MANLAAIFSRTWNSAYFPQKTLPENQGRPRKREPHIPVFYTAKNKKNARGLPKAIPSQKARPSRKSSSFICFSFAFVEKKPIGAKSKPTQTFSGEKG